MAVFVYSPLSHEPAVRDLAVCPTGKDHPQHFELPLDRLTILTYEALSNDVEMEALRAARPDLVICDEINNAVHDGLLTEKQLEELIKKRAKKTSLCLTGRNFPKKLLKYVDIATDMSKIKHHFDDKFLANKGIDF